MKYVIIAILSLLLWNCKDKNQVESQEEKPVKTKNVVSKEGAVHPVAPELFSQFINVRDFTINTEENEAYFTLLSPARELSVIMRIQKENNVWSEPKITSFSGQYTDLEPYLSPDGLQLYFASNRPVSKDSTHTKDFDIWYVERPQKDSKWSEPKHIKAPVNSTYDEFYPAITLSKNLYFTAIKEGMNGQDDIFMSRWNGNSYEEPIALDEGVNTKGAEFNAYVAPDESYILFSGWRRPDGIGSGDLYLSKREQGKWQTAVNLGATINSEHTDYCPFVNTATGTLYFTSRRSYVEKKDAGYSNYNELLTEINRYDNGSSRIYKVDITDLISQ